MILIDYKDRRPIYEQIVEKIETLILKGVFEPDTMLPSVRSLAIELSINPNTIQRAYAELERRGITYTVKGKGSFVSSPKELIDSKKEELKTVLQAEFKQAKEIGITKNELITLMNASYEEENE
ncbi:MAG: GntR family transcriptional regulator [Lachnospiraceae bacterium]|nr:GntR family transcriptional regulator [Lachnospiraceae bacterium]